MPRGIYKGNDGKSVACYQLNKTHCRKGHPYSEENTTRWPSQPKSRRCLICERSRSLYKWNKKAPEIRRSHHLKYTYGMTPEEFNKALSAQDGRCAICLSLETAMDKRGNVKELSVDHNHSTGKIRGLLCHSCNVGLGRFKDNINFLASAINYLKKHEQI